MRYYLKKVAVSGVISATLFALFFYFVYQAESAKNEPQASTQALYTEETADTVNSIVVQTIEQEIARENKKIARVPTIQRITTASPSSTPTFVPAASQPLTIPSLPPAIEPSSVAIPNIGSISIPSISIPAPIPIPVIATAPQPTIAQAPVPAPQKTAKATAPRTTVS